MRMLSAVLIAFSAASVAAQDSSTKGNTRSAGGEVALKKSPIRFVRYFLLYDSETQEPVNDAEIQNLRTGEKVVSDSQGVFALISDSVVKNASILVFQGDTLSLQIRKVGYAPIVLGPLDPSAGPDKDLAIPLEKAKKVTLLPGMNVTAVAKRTQLEQLAQETGELIATRDDLKDAESLEEVFRKKKIAVPDLKEQLNPSKRMMPGQRKTNCPVRVLIDGSSIGADLVSYNDSPAQWDGLIYFRPHHQLPLSVDLSNGPNSCGTIVLYTRIH